MNEMELYLSNSDFKHFIDLISFTEDLLEVRKINMLTGEVDRDFCSARELILEYAKLHEWNDENYGIFISVCTRTREGGTKSDVGSTQVVWADIDHITIEEARSRLQESILPPFNMLIHSGHGVHVYWRLESPIDGHAAEPIVAAIAEELDGDRAVKDCSRVMRAPGFMNVKPGLDPVACRIVEYHPERRVDVSAFDDVIAKHASETAAPIIVSTSVNETTSNFNRAEKYVTAVPGKPDGERTKTSFVLATKFKTEFGLGIDEARPLMVNWNCRCTPPLPDAKLEHQLQAGYKYGKPNPNHTIQPQVTAAYTPPSKTNSSARSEFKPLAAPGQHDGVNSLQEKLRLEKCGLIEEIKTPIRSLNVLSRCMMPATLLVLCGVPGVGKTFMILGWMLHLMKSGVKWAFLPLEDSPEIYIRRAIAILSGRFDCLTDAGLTMQMMKKYSSVINEFAAHIMDNPRSSYREADTRLVRTFQVYGDHIREWADRMLSTHQVVFIDSLSMIDRSDREQWLEEQSLVADLTSIARERNGVVVLVCHTVKNAGKKRLGLNDVQGAAALTRQAHTVLMLGSGVPDEGYVLDPKHIPGARKVEHSHVLAICKARNARGSGREIALQFGGVNGDPRFQEVGVLATEAELNKLGIKG